MKSDSNSDLACQSYAGLNLCSCILIGVFHEEHILFWNTLLSQTPPDFLSWYPVVRLLKVYKHQVQFFLHFPVFLYHLPCCKYGNSCPSAQHETELIFSYACLFPQSSVDTIQSLSRCRIQFGRWRSWFSTLPGFLFFR